MIINTKERLLQAIETTPEPILALILAILEFLRKPTNFPHIETLTTLIAPPPNSPTEIGAEPILRNSKAKDLLKAASTWQGDDFEECLDLVYQTRSPIES